MDNLDAIVAAVNTDAFVPTSAEVDFIDRATSFTDVGVLDEILDEVFEEALARKQQRLQPRQLRQPAQQQQRRQPRARRRRSSGRKVARAGDSDGSSGDPPAAPLDPTVERFLDFLVDAAFDEAVADAKRGGAS